MAEPNKGGKQQTPSPPPQPQHQALPPQQSTPVVAKDWKDQAEEFLTDHGWLRVGCNEVGISYWKDPKGNLKAAEADVTFEIPYKEDGVQKSQTVVQKSVAPHPWVFRLDDAVAIQRRRSGEPTPTEERDCIIEKYNALLTKHNQLLKRLTDLSVNAKFTTSAAVRSQIQRIMQELGVKEIVRESA